MEFFSIEGFSKRSIALVYLLKIVFGIMLWAVYTFYYTDRSTADIYKYFDDSKVIFDALFERPLDYFKMLTGIGNDTPSFNKYYSEMDYWAKKADSNLYNDSHTIIRFNALVRLFSFGYYNVHTVVICFFSLIGLTAIYKTFSASLAGKQKELFFAVFLLPSVLFWSSGVLKEGLIFFALGLLIYYSNRLFQAKAILFCLATAFLLAFSKFYVWLAILPSLLYLIWINKSGTNKLMLKYLLVIFAVAVTGLNIDKFTNVQNPLVTLSQKQIEFNRLAGGELTDAQNRPIPEAGSIIHLPRLEPTFPSFLANAPIALVNTFIRPFPSDMKTPFIILAGFESILMIVIIIICLVFIQKLNSVRWEYFLFCISFVILQFLIIGETTPILGAIVRYKTIALPFLVIGCLYLLDKDKICSKVPLYRKIFF